MNDSIHDQNGMSETTGTPSAFRWDEVRERTTQAIDEGTDYLRENPIPAIAAALGIGILVGSFLFRKSPPSFSERYIEEPLHESRAAILALLAASGALLKKSLHDGRAIASDVAESVEADLKHAVGPLAKAARKQARKLGL